MQSVSGKMSRDRISLCSWYCWPAICCVTEADLGFIIIFLPSVLGLQTHHHNQNRPQWNNFQKKYKKLIHTWKRTFNITSHHRNANPDYTERWLHPSQKNSPEKPKQEMLVRLWAKRTFKRCWWSCTLHTVQSTQNQHGAFSWNEKWSWAVAQS